MKNTVLRAVVAAVAVAAMAGAGFEVWDLERLSAAERHAADLFERQARLLTLDLANLRADWQAYVADGQNTTAWLTTGAEQYTLVTAHAEALRPLTRSPEGQGLVESAVETIAALSKTDARARDFLASNQRLSASDVVFGEASPQTVKAARAVDVARGQESIASATTLEGLRVWQLYAVGGAAVVVLLAVLMLLPVPKLDEGAALADIGDLAPDTQPATDGLGLGRVTAARARVSGGDDRPLGRPPVADATSPARPAARPSARQLDLAATAELCSALARVVEPRELPALLERAATILDAAGLVVWMPDGPGGALRPALAHGYSPLVVTRMGTLPVDADNATAVAFRTMSAQIVPAEAGANGAVVAPLVTAEGCSGVMAVELNGSSDAEQARAAAAIITAQLATLISPATVPAKRNP
jgi:hypothetical protein